jgi:DNA invertase Pin-like site-specific DNA recombinase
MNQDAHQKVKTTHLKRNAYLYIRQSTLRQVFENSESTKRQYALRQKAVALGWPEDRIVVLDSDLGQSGASAADREGFQRLVTEVSLGRAGIVLGLEVSRLARNSTDWHRLLEICALTDALILDEDGIYDPAHFNDRLLLGLKGTMSEAQLHVLRARLQGGILNKARRGELMISPPIGSGQARATVLALIVRNLPQHRIRNGHSESVSKARSAVSETRSHRNPQGRLGVGRLGTHPGAAHPAQSEVCRSLCLRTKPHAQNRGRSFHHCAAPARRMGDVDSGSLPRLSVLGGLPAKSEAPSRKCTSAGTGPAQEPGP